MSERDSVGSMGLSRAGAWPYAEQQRLNQRDTVTNFLVRLDKLPIGAPAWVGASARVAPVPSDAAGSYYLGRLRIDPSGRAYLVAIRYRAGEPPAQLAPIAPLLHGAGAERGEARVPL